VRGLHVGGCHFLQVGRYPTAAAAAAGCRWHITCHVGRRGKEGCRAIAAGGRGRAQLFGGALFQERRPFHFLNGGKAC